MGVGSSVGNRGSRLEYEPEIPEYNRDNLNPNMYGPAIRLPDNVMGRTYTAEDMAAMATSGAGYGTAAYGVGTYMPPNVMATRQHNTTTIHNLVNLQPSSLRIMQDERNKATYHIQFDFDAKVACNVTIYYTGSSRISPETKNVVVSTSGPLQSNMRLGFPAGNKQFFDGQLFRSEALNTSVYGASDLIHKKGTNVFPVIIVLSVNSEAVRALGGDPTIANGTRAQVTYATLVAKDDVYQLRCIKQDVIDPNGQNYEVSQIYGLKNQSTDGAAGETGECVICMTDPVTTVILPCRHMCLCSSCSISLKLQAGKCPICRGDASELLQINVKM